MGNASSQIDGAQPTQSQSQSQLPAQSHLPSHSQALPQRKVLPSPPKTPHVIKRFTDADLQASIAKQARNYSDDEMAMSTSKREVPHEKSKKRKRSSEGKHAVNSPVEDASRRHDHRDDLAVLKERIQNVPDVSSQEVKKSKKRKRSSDEKAIQAAAAGQAVEAPVKSASSGNIDRAEPAHMGERVLYAPEVASQAVKKSKRRKHSSEERAMRAAPIERAATAADGLDDVGHGKGTEHEAELAASNSVKKHKKDRTPEEKAARKEAKRERRRVREEERIAEEERAAEEAEDQARRRKAMAVIEAGAVREMEKAIRNPKDKRQLNKALALAAVGAVVEEEEANLADDASRSYSASPAESSEQRKHRRQSDLQSFSEDLGHEQDEDEVYDDEYEEEVADEDDDPGQMANRVIAEHFQDPTETQEAEDPVEDQGDEEEKSGHVWKWLDKQPISSQDMHSPSTVDQAVSTSTKRSPDAGSSEEAPRANSVQRSTVNSKSKYASAPASGGKRANFLSRNNFRRQEPRILSHSSGVGAYTAEEIATVEVIVGDYRDFHRLTQEVVAERIQRNWQLDDSMKELMEALHNYLPNRPKRSLVRYCQRNYHTRFRGRWTEEADEELKTLQAEKPNKWLAIAADMGRFPDDCRDRWRNHLKYANANKDEWSKEEEENLIRAVGECEETMRENGELGPDEDVPFDKISWNAVAEKMDGERTRLQCRYKWKKIRHWGERLRRHEEDEAAYMRLRETGDAGPSAFADVDPDLEQRVKKERILIHFREKALLRAAGLSEPNVRLSAEYVQDDPEESNSEDAKVEHAGEDQVQGDNDAHVEVEATQENLPESSVDEEQDAKQTMERKAAKQRKSEKKKRAALPPSSPEIPESIPEEVGQANARASPEPEEDEAPDTRDDRGYTRRSKSELKQRAKHFPIGHKYMMLYEMLFEMSNCSFVNKYEFWSHMKEEYHARPWQSDDRMFVFKAMRKRTGVPTGEAFHPTLKNIITQLEVTTDAEALLRSPYVPGSLHDEEMHREASIRLRESL